MKILNPATRRYVKVDGKIGKLLVMEKEKILENIKEKCNNSYDPISLEEFKDLELDKLRSIVQMGSGNAYLLENIYMVYKTAIESKKIPKDPMNPEYALSESDIDEINAKMLSLDENYVPPAFKRAYPEGYDIMIVEHPRMREFYQIVIIKDRNVVHDLGVIPGWVEILHTGCTSSTSAVLVSHIQELWDKCLLMNPEMTKCVVKGLERKLSYWMGFDWVNRFVKTCQKMSDAIIYSG